VVKHHLLPLAGYALLTVGFTYPTAFRLTTHIPGGGDAPWFLWQLWWFKHAIVDLRQSPLVTNLIYYPLTDVPVTWQTPINEFFTIPLQMVTGVVLLYNLLFLASFVLSGYFMYLLVASVVRRRDLAFVAGLIFAFCAYRGVRGLGHLSLLTTQWMPLSLLLLIQCWRRPTIARGLATGIGIGLVALSSPYYVAYFLLPLALVGGLYVLIWRRPLLKRPPLWSAALVAALIAAAMTLPFYAGFLQADQEWQNEARAISGSVVEYSADLLSWFLPAREHPVWGQYTAQVYDQFSTRNPLETTVFFGLLPLLLAIGSAFVRWPGRRQVVFWQVLAALTWLMSFGPVLHVDGRPVIGWMPYRLFMSLPGAYFFRTPSRVAIVTVIAGAILAAMMLERWIVRRPNWPWRVFLVIWSAFLLFNMAFRFPYRGSSTAVPPVYEQIARTPGDFAILELPAGELFFGQMSWYMYYQTYHNKRLVSGYLGRRPPRLHAQERAMPFVRRFFTNDPNRLVDLPGEATTLAQAWPEDIRNANVLLYNQGIRYVVLHCQSMQGSFCQPASALLNLGLGLPVYRDETTMLYEATPEGGSTVMGFDNVVPAYDEAFSEPFVREGRYTRMAQGGGTITLTLPLAGTWSLQGELEGDLAGEVQFAVDGEAMSAQTTVYSETLQTFSLRTQLEPGSHNLLLRVPGGDANSADQSCSRLCVRNLIVRLDELAVMETKAAQAFGGRVSLAGYSLQEYRFSEGDLPEYALFTRWSCQAPIPKDYTLYVHYVDGSGTLLAQDDHLLGRSHSSETLPTSQWTCPDHYYDVSYVPRELAEAGGIEVALGLWVPETGERLTPSGELPVDSYGGVRLKIEDLER
jgi:hypothetical protein